MKFLKFNEKFIDEEKKKIRKDNEWITDIFNYLFTLKIIN